MTAIACVRIPRSAPGGALAALVQDFSPRFELVRSDVAIVDVSGLGRLVGDADEIGAALCRLASQRGVPAVVSLAPTRTAALLLALGSRARLTIVGAGEARARLAPLPLRVLAELSRVESSETIMRPSPARPTTRRRHAGGGGRHYRLAPVPAGPGPGATRPPPDVTTATGVLVDPVLDDVLQTLSRWGLSTLGEFAGIPSIDLFERLGTAGVAWQAVSRGCDGRPLVRTTIEEPLEASLALDWPIETLEPLSFVLGRLLDPLCARLDRRRAGAAALQVTLQLVSRELHVRTLPLPSPMRDARVLRTLALLDLESHPPAAAIDRVTVTLDAVPGRIVQYSLLTRALPIPEQMATLTARLSAVMGEERVGTPVLVDSHRPGAFEMHRFTGEVPGTAREPPCARGPEVPAALRRFRHPIPARVTTKGGRPERVAVTHPVLRGGVVVQAAGPWRTSGEWWTGRESSGGESDDRNLQPVAGSPALLPWDRDEWDVVVRSGAVLRLFRDRTTGRWSVEAVVD